MKTFTGRAIHGQVRQGASRETARFLARLGALKKVRQQVGPKSGKDGMEAGLLRRFVTGLVWGGVVAGLGLAVISQVAPRPVALPKAGMSGTGDAAPPAAVAEDVPSAAPAVREAPADEAAPAEPKALETAQATAPVAETAAPEAPLPAASAFADDAPKVVAEATAATPAAKPDAVVQAPTPPEAAPEPVLDPAPADLSAQVAADSAAPAALAASDSAKDSATESGLAVAPKADAAPAVGAAPAAIAASEEPLLTPAPQAPAISKTDPAPPVVSTVQDPPRLLTPDSDPGLPGTMAVVLPDAQPESSNLPQIGAAPESETAEQALPEATVIDDLPPIAAYARPFENADAKPLFAILLVDDGSAMLDRATLAALPFPVTFVVDPQAPNAAEAAAIYRAGLQEVVMTATGLPEGTELADIERSFEANATTLPETVAVIDTGPQGRLEDRTVAAAVVPILQDQGRGLITYDVGLNAADQAARRAALPTVALFRVLDAEGESQSTIRRYLDRAAFKAAQEGKVVVLGSTRPETVAALLEWTVEGRAASVALAPVTAVLAAQ